MCSRFELNAPPRELARRFRLDAPPPTPNAMELRPTDLALVIGRSTVAGDGPIAWLLRWGLRVTWHTKPLINARAETLAEKRSFRPLLGRRCLVPATAWFEWRKAGRTKLKNRIRPQSIDGEEIFAFAGIADDERFTIVTCAAAPDVAHIHDRMPVVLASGEAGARWIDPTLPFPDVAPYLVPYAGPLAADEETSSPEKQKKLFG
jgi:putative SOS response-associated peptidase YedK